MATGGRASGRVGTWPAGGEGARGGRAYHWPDSLPDFARALAASCRQWVIADVGPGRLLPWLPIAFGGGVAAYFTAAHEPEWWTTGVLLLPALAAVVLARNRPVAFPIALAFAAIAAGFSTATLRTLHVDHPVLHQAAYNVSLGGFVEVREERERTDRIVLRVNKIEGERLKEKPDRVRLSVKKGTAPPVGAYVELTARLNPPMTPLRPGGYDLARDLYFQRIGAMGFVSGAIKIAAPPAAGGFWLGYASAIEGIRDAIDQRIRAAAPGDAGSIASAVITGKRDALSAPVNDAMYVSSLAHVLSISGYHMAVVAGVVFFVVRGLLALSLTMAIHYPIKKWAAGAALVAATLYLLLSGVEVATQRSYFMTAIVLVGVMVDRAALTLRNIALAALAVLLLAPEAVVNPSFQMSFAATLALIATYERGLPWTLRGSDSSLGARIALWGVREIVSLLLASFVAGSATMPYAAYHFHRLAPYGALANLLAMPIVSAWVMPAGMLALIAMPFGFDGPLWRFMGVGVDWMITVAQWVAHLPGAVGRVTAFGVGPLLVCTAGLLVICLLRTPLRWLGATLVVVSLFWAAATPLPDVLIASDANAMAVRTAGGRLAVIKSGNEVLAAKDWLAADADARLVADKSLADGVACDTSGCVARLADGALVALAKTPEAIAEDCSRAVLVVSQRQIPPKCAATAIDRTLWRQQGAMALRRLGQHWEIEAARPSGFERPWTGTVVTANQPGAGAPNAPTAASRPATRDATPKAQDLEADD